MKVLTNTFLLAALYISPVVSPAATVLSDNLSSTSAGTEASAESSWLAASFGTDSSTYSLNNVVIDLANLTASSVSAQVAI